ncbi:MAG: DUF1501 domain-containing protein [Burkholderiaceae bacterium]
MNRRNFIRLGAIAAVATTGLPSLVARAGTVDYKAAVCVFLSGGCDANNLLVPTDDQRYGAYSLARQGLAIPRGQLLPIAPLSGGAYGLHPSMSGLQTLFQQKRLAVLTNVGTLIQPVTRDQVISNAYPLPDNLLSHIDQQNQWSTLNPGASDMTGWGGRMADALTTANANARFPPVISVAGNNVFCDGAVAVSTAIDSGGSNAFPVDMQAASDAARSAAINEMVSEAQLGQIDAAYITTVKDALAQAKTVSSVFNTGLTTQFPATDIGQQLFRTAQAIASRSTLGLNRQVFYVEQGGYDTHANQLLTQSDLFTQLSQALSAFYSALVELGVDQNVVTFTHSEFSRTLKPSGDNGNGSDHAWGGHSLIMGGPVKGGDTYGTFPQLVLSGPDDVTDEGRWAPTTSVDQYAATIAAWMGVPAVGMGSVLPNLASFKNKTLPFL